MSTHSPGSEGAEAPDLREALIWNRARWQTMGGPWSGPAIHFIDEVLAAAPPLADGTDDGALGTILDEAKAGPWKPDDGTSLWFYNAVGDQLHLTGDDVVLLLEAAAQRATPPSAPDPEHCVHCWQQGFDTGANFVADGGVPEPAEDEIREYRLDATDPENARLNWIEYRAHKHVAAPDPEGLPSVDAFVRAWMDHARVAEEASNKRLGIKDARHRCAPVCAEAILARLSPVEPTPKEPHDG